MANSCKGATCSLPVKTTKSQPVQYTRRAYSDGEMIQLQQRSRTAAGYTTRKIWRSKVKLRRRKIIVIGDMNSGKTSLITAYCHDKYTDTYTPTILRTMCTEAIIKDNWKQTIDLILIDTPGRRDYYNIRRCTYPNADLIILCFALDQPETLHNITQYWMKEINEWRLSLPVVNSARNKAAIPLVLVGTCSDRRDEIYASYCQCSICTSQSTVCNTTSNNNDKLENEIVLYEQGYSVAQEIGALLYLECSAKYRIGIRNVFEQSIYMAVKKHHKKRRRKKNYQYSENSGCTIL